MNGAFLLSVVLKGLGAVLEIFLQILITGAIGVEGYGTYAAWINGADLIFWIALSGLVKCNTFYLSEKNVSIGGFKRKYYFRYAVPLLTAVAAALFAIKRNAGMLFIPLIAGAELLVLDHSSALLARGKVKRSLVGEYTLGRMILVIGVLLMKARGDLQIRNLLCLYLFQYAMILLLFRFKQGGRECTDISQQVSIRKWGAFQQSDLMHAMIEQMPVVVQYLFSGAFEAGVVSIVLLVKKLINFISGPTAKVFLPEFSRLYHAGDREGICSCYCSIMRIQMIAVGPMAVVLLGYPGVVLGILAKELVSYRVLFVLCSVIFLLTASLGPCGGILQMTGNERQDNRCRLAALAAMILIMLITRKDSYFVLYGLCGQVALEVCQKYVQVCKWMEKAPVKAAQYLRWWLLPCIVIAAAYFFRVQDSFVAMTISVIVVFAAGMFRELKTMGGRIDLLKGKP